MGNVPVTPPFPLEPRLIAGTWVAEESVRLATGVVLAMENGAVPVLTVLTIGIEKVLLPVKLLFPLATIGVR
jgi:hypothetical protein